MLRRGLLLKWCDLSMTLDGIMPSLKNRLASFVKIEIKTPLHTFRRVVEIRSLSDVSWHRKIHQ